MKLSIEVEKTFLLEEKHTSRKKKDIESSIL